MRTLIICEKRDNMEKIENVIYKYFYQEGENEFDFDYVHTVLHLNDECIHLRKRGDKIYQGHSEVLDLIPLELNDVEVPKDTFFISNCPHPKANLKKTYDLIIDACDPDDNGVLAFKKYMETHNIKGNEIKFAHIVSLLENDILDALNALSNFDKVFNDTIKRLKDSNFASAYPRKQDVLFLREKAGMTRKEFCDFFDIPYRTMENWEFDEARCPIYLYELMKYKLEKEGKLK